MIILRDDDAPEDGAGVGPTLVGYLSWVLRYDNNVRSSWQPPRDWDRTKEWVMKTKWEDVE